MVAHLTVAHQNWEEEEGQDGLPDFNSVLIKNCQDWNYLSICSVIWCNEKSFYKPWIWKRGQRWARRRRRWRWWRWWWRPGSSWSSGSRRRGCPRCRPQRWQEGWTRQTCRVSALKFCLKNIKFCRKKIAICLNTIKCYLKSIVQYTDPTMVEGPNFSDWKPLPMMPITASRISGADDPLKSWMSTGYHLERKLRMEDPLER